MNKCAVLLDALYQVFQYFIITLKCREFDTQFAMNNPTHELMCPASAPWTRRGNKNVILANY